MIRSLAAALSLTLLSGCGFTPLYSVEGQTSVASAMRNVYLNGITGPAAAAYELNSELQDNLPGEAPVDARYQLSIALKDQRRAISVTRSAATTRYNYILRANYTLLDTETGERRRNSLDAAVGYGVVESQYASIVGREDAERRAVIELARKIEFDIALFMKNRAPEAGTVNLPTLMEEDLIGDDLRNEDSDPVTDDVIKIDQDPVSP